MSDVSKRNPVIGEASTWFDLGGAIQDAERHQERLSAFTHEQVIDPNSFPAKQDRCGVFLTTKYTTARGYRHVTPGPTHFRLVWQRGYRRVVNGKHVFAVVN